METGCAASRAEARTTGRDPRLERLLRLGRTCAVREGLPAALWDDCAITFAEKILLREDRGALTDDACLRTCARNHAVDMRRRAVRRTCRELPLDAADDSRLTPSPTNSHGSLLPLNRLLRDELAFSVRQALYRLDPHHRRLIERHHLEGESIEAIACSLGVSAQTVAQRIYRARKHLRACLVRGGVIEPDSLAVLQP